MNKHSLLKVYKPLLVGLIALFLLIVIPSGAGKDPSYWGNMMKVMLNKIFLAFLSVGIAHILWKSIFTDISFTDIHAKRGKLSDIPLGLYLLRGLFYAACIIGFMMGI